MMRILSITSVLFVCMFPVSLFAENEAVDKGSFEIGLDSILDVSLATGNLEASELTIGSYWTKVNFGYFIIDKLSIGGAVSFWRYKYKGDTEEYTEFFFGPYIRYYIPISERILANLGALFLFSSFKGPGDTDRSSQMAFGGRFALTYLLTNNLGLVGGVTFAYSPDYKDEGIKISDTSYTVIDFGLGFTVYL